MHVRNVHCSLMTKKVKYSRILPFLHIVWDSKIDHNHNHDTARGIILNQTEIKCGCCSASGSIFMLHIMIIYI